jgi:Domain of unknown function (DUF4150)
MFATRASRGGPAFGRGHAVTKTYANGKTLVHRGDGLQFVAMVPDVCKTPSPGGPVPLPYPNIALSSDLADGTKTIEVEGNPVATARSKLSTSTGDEAGTAGGGIVSGKIKGALKWMLSSIDVKFEGQGVVRFLDDTMHNGNAGNTSGKTLGKAAIPGQDEDIKCDNCGKPLPGHPQLEQDAESRASAKQASGHTTAAVVVRSPNGETATFTNFAGNNRAKLTTDSFQDLAKNFKHGTPIKPRPETDRFPPGNCAEQKALYDAFSSGKLILASRVNATMSAMRELKSGEKEHVAACRTCQRVLTSMLCTNSPKPAPH